MPKRSSKPKDRDVNTLAKSITEQATGQAAPGTQEAKPKNAAAVELGRLGGLKGGVARANSLTKAKLSAIGKKGARARWGPRKDSRRA